MKNVSFLNIIILLILIVNISCSWFSSSAATAEEPINVHIIPHTHDDAGWLYSLEDYYTGNNNSGKCVKCILDNMLTSLEANKDRTFTYVEMGESMSFALKYRQ